MAAISDVCHGRLASEMVAFPSPRFLHLLPSSSVSSSHEGTPDHLLLSLCSHWRDFNSGGVPRLRKANGSPQEPAATRKCIA